jgi:hypothetical protein
MVGDCWERVGRAAARVAVPEMDEDEDDSSWWPASVVAYNNQVKAIPPSVTLQH